MLLILAEHNGKTLAPVTAHLVTAAASLGGEIHILLAGHKLSSIAAEAAKLKGVSKVLVADAPHLAAQLAEDTAALMATHATSYSHVFAPATSFGKNILPRLAALLDVAMVSDAIAMLDARTFKRPIYAGNAIATVQTNDAIVLATIRKTAFDAAPQAESPATITPLPAPEAQTQSRLLHMEAMASERPELTSAARVVSGGRGLGSRDGFKLVEDLADVLGAAVGASRAAVDAGYAPNDWQVGQTGKIVAPELYLAIGISGAIQHLAGMKESKIIVAINKDENAPIFDVADYGLVADLFQAVPELMEQLRK